MTDIPAAPRGMTADGPTPIILTVAIRAEDMQTFDGLRRQHFPPERNLLSAHVTMFHHLPGARAPQVLRTLRQAVTECSAFSIDVTGLRLLGGGVAFSLDASEMRGLRARLRSEFEPWLTRQDLQRWQPHITIQNKVAPATARDLHDSLRTGFKPWQIRGEGLQAWSYLGGPWRPLASFGFGIEV